MFINLYIYIYEKKIHFCRLVVLVYEMKKIMSLDDFIQLRSFFFPIEKNDMSLLKKIAEMFSTTGYEYHEVYFGAYYWGLGWDGGYGVLLREIYNI